MNRENSDEKSIHDISSSEPLLFLFRWSLIASLYNAFNILASAMKTFR